MRRLRLPASVVLMVAAAVSAAPACRADFITTVSTPAIGSTVAGSAVGGSATFTATGTTLTIVVNDTVATPTTQQILTGIVFDIVTAGPGPTLGSSPSAIVTPGQFLDKNTGNSQQSTAAAPIDISG